MRTKAPVAVADECGSSVAAITIRVTACNESMDKAIGDECWRAVGANVTPQAIVRIPALGPPRNVDVGAHGHWCGE